MSVSTAPLAPLPRRFVSLDIYRICAYCAEPAAYVVYATDDHDVIGSGFCCDEPTHWVWLLADVEEFEREEREA